MRELVSCGDSTTQLREEIRHLGKAERQRLLHDAGFTLNIPEEHGLAMKAELGILWNKLRVIRRQVSQLTRIKNYTISVRWLTEWGISLSSEKKQRKLARKLLGDNLEAEAIPLTYPLKKTGGEELRATAYSYVPDLVSRVQRDLEEKEK